MDAEVAAAVADAHRREWGFVLAATVRVTRDIDLAEEAVQEAFAQALGTWAETGIPERPGAWLTTVARRRALDALRRDIAFERSIPLLVEDAVQDSVADDAVADDRLRLIFICCHPALPMEARVALTLRLLCGLSTPEIARAFLVPEPTMAARITRAKKKIAEAHIPYRVPSDQELPDRVDAVLTVLHLLYTTGHTAPVGSDLIRPELLERALDLARMLRLLLPNDPNVAGLYALLLLTDARRGTRTDDAGAFLPLAEQDRRRWDRRAISEGIALVRKSLRGHAPGRFPLMAAIAAVHAEAPEFDATDWHEIAGLYDHLIAVWPSPVVALNRAVALGHALGPQRGLDELDLLSTNPQLAAYHYLPAARAEFLTRLNRFEEARLAYQEALLLASNTVEATYLTTRLHNLNP
ncbi:sigma-70 family RNA polymerase sigma factor [Nocardia sp. CDC153]|uniref:RNA polymerase sigma factor n=1 Tax=Nocardia sp. CDC153 TaxID=3112167 RepID=UPI002DBA391F|nr:sigma-70 family RNA polymerase sigma factor [Nocardia sp. CDC153]MEC3952692.1 sigma-70 family RNA polymerase sigma factor [Nocardia sp. CDC153]